MKARLDGEYREKESFLFDTKCFFGTIFSVLRSDGIVEGGTGEMKKHGPILPDDGETVYPEDAYQSSKK